jgi:hypothetical protein
MSGETGATRMTQDSKRPPKANFFLVGAPKAGTTSVDRLLRKHAEVFLSPIKEPCHFCPDVNEQIAPSLQRKDRIDLKAYLSSRQRDVVHLAHVASANDYARLFEGAENSRIIGECSTYYLSSQAAARNIRAYNPNAKILALVREPLERIRSHYAMDRSLGVATRPLPDLVEEELALGERAHWGNCRYYVGASRYARQLAEYRRHFADEQICVLSFEQLIADPDRTLRRLFSFLDIALPAGPLVLPLENKSRGVRFPRLHDGLRESGLKPIVAGMLKSATGTRLGRMARSVYYRDKAQVASPEELHRVGLMLRDEGLDLPVSHVDVEAA